MLNFIKNFILVINHFAEEIKQEREAKARWETGRAERTKRALERHKSSNVVYCFKENEEQHNQNI